MVLTPDFELIASRKATALALIGRDRTAPVMAEQRDLRIPSPDGGLAARFYRPKGAGAEGGALLYFHGGGFVHGDLETHDALCRRLAAASRLRVMAIDYRLAPEHPYPAQIDDGETAARWLLAHLADFGVAPGQLLIGGDSAGGYIAVAVTALMRREAPSPFAGQVLIYPLLQVDDALWSSSRFEDARMIGRLAVSYIRNWLQAGDGGIPSLLDHDPAGSPPTLIATGGPLDPCRPDARAYGDALAAAGVSVRMLGYSTLPHGFGNLTHALKGARAAVAEIGHAAAEMLNAAAAAERAQL